MQNATRVHILEAAKNLVEEELDMLVTENLVRFDDLGEISFHQVGYDIEFIELLKGFRLQDTFD